MKLNKFQTERLVKLVFSELKNQKIITFKEPEDKVFRRAVELIGDEYEMEKQIEREAHAMVDDLEKKQGGGFDRHKMYLMVKNQLAKQKGVIL